VASLSQGRTAAAQCGLFTYKSVPVIFEPPCIQRRTQFLLEKKQTSFSVNLKREKKWKNVMHGMHL